MTFPSQVPDAGTPLFDDRGYINPVWHQFFFTLLSRTGGAEGAESVIDVIGALPITSTHGGSPIIGINPATPSSDGSFSAADKTKLDTVSANAKVSSVTATAPIVSSGGTTPDISIVAASSVNPGSMSAADKTKLDTVTTGAAVASVGASAPLSSTGGLNPSISIAAATGSSAGSLSAADKTKLDLLTYATGTWVPQITFATPGDLAVTYAAQFGTYTKIGRMVFINFMVQTSAYSQTTASGNLIVNGVPLASGASSQIAGVIDFQGITKAGYNSFTSSLDPGAVILTFIGQASGAYRSFVTAADVPTGSIIFLSGTMSYYV